MLNLVVSIVTTGLFRVNIGLDGGALLFVGNERVGTTRWNAL